MNSEKIIHEYYQSEVDKINVPPLTLFKRERKSIRNKVYNIGFAAVLVLSGLSIVGHVDSPSSLSMKAAQFSEIHKAGEVISGGLWKINKLTSISLKSGGK